MRRKTIVWTAGIALVIVLAAAWSLPAWLHARVEKELRSFFKTDRVSAGRIFLERSPALAVEEILVDGEGYQLTVQKASVDAALNLKLMRPRLQIRSVPSEWAGASGASSAPPEASPVRSVTLRDLEIDVQLPKLAAKIRGSVGIDLQKNQVRTAHLEVSSVASNAIRLEKIQLELPGDGAGTFRAERLKIGKLKVTEIQGGIVWEGTTILMRPITAKWIGGDIEGEARLLTQLPFDYDMDFEIRNLDLSVFTQQMELSKKMTADGRAAGRVSMEGSLEGIRVLKGSFASDAPGGNLIIEDPNWLKYLAQNTRQPLPLVEAAFKEYRFDTAAATLAASGRDLKFAVRMNGEKGRRDFDVNLHDQL